MGVCFHFAVLGLDSVYVPRAGGGYAIEQVGHGGIPT